MKMMGLCAKGIVFGLAFMLAAFAQTPLDPLPRRGYFGVGLESSPDGVRVFSVSPGSTAEAFGVAIGDVIVAVDGKPAGTPQAVVAAVGFHRSGELIRVDVLRSGARQSIAATLKPFPVEQMANASVHYESVAVSSGVRLRTILSIPTAAGVERYPAILLIGGGGCGSIDSPFDIKTGLPGLIHTFGSRGFVTMRVEKSGTGDSQGPPCDSIGYAEELAGYQAALKALLENPSVNDQQIYLVGISLGGVFAPILAAETKVAGVSVYGTPAKAPPPYPGRSERFFQEFSGVDVAAAWARVGTRVQVLHGEYDVDPVINRAAHESIVATVNKSGKGSAQFTEFPGLDHCWSRHASLEASLNKCGQGEATTAVADAILAFMTMRQ
jgi:dienelactone hydrolase